MSTLGIVYLKNVDGFDEAGLLNDIREFHDMPDEVKHTLKVRYYNPENSNIFHGLFPFIDNSPSHREIFDMGSPIEDADENERR